jgi:hypothetical protein
MILADAMTSMTYSVATASWGWAIVAGAVGCGIFALGFLWGRRQQESKASIGAPRDQTRGRVVMSDMPSEMMQEIVEKGSSAVSPPRRCRKRMAFIPRPRGPRGRRRLAKRHARRRAEK